MFASLADSRMKGGAVVFAIALTVRLIYSFVSFQTYFNNDAIGFHNVAVNVAEGHGYSSSIAPPYEPHFLREPGYPLFLASVYYVYSFVGQPHLITADNPYSAAKFPETYWARVAQSIVGAATCVIFYLLMLLRLRPRVSLGIAILFAAYLPLAAFSSLLLRETLQTFFLVAIAYSFARFMLSERISWLAGFALLWALSNLTLQTTILLFAPVFVFCWIWFRSFRRSLGYTALATAIMLLLVSPWLIRTYNFYPDLRVLKSFGTSLTPEARDYGFSQFSLNMAGIISKDSSLGNIHKYYYDIPERLKFERSFNGYYEAEAARARKALAAHGDGATVRTPVTLAGRARQLFAYMRHCWIESLWVVERADGAYDMRPHGYYRVIEKNTPLFLLSMFGFIFGYAAFPGIFLFYRKLFPLMLGFTYFVLLIPIVGDEERRFLPAHAFIFLFASLFYYYAYWRLVKRESAEKVNARIFQPSILPPAEASERPVITDQVALEM